MRLLVTHLTRMTHPNICVAGIALETLEHVRPVRSSDDRLTPLDTREQGGIFALGAVVDLAEARRCGSPPETEDHRYRPDESTFERMATEDELWSTLGACARDDLGSIFGPELRERGDTYAVNEGAGCASLGCLRAKQPLDLYARPRDGKLRLAIGLDGRDRDLPVTDLRLFGHDFASPNGEAVAALNTRLKHADEIVLCVGLTRPYAAADGTARHWLQVNTIFCR